LREMLYRCTNLPRSIATSSECEIPNAKIIKHPQNSYTVSKRVATYKEKMNVVYMGTLTREQNYTR